MRQCKHPCPGCGKTDYWGTKGTLCSDCKTTLKVGQEVQKARTLAKNAPIGVFLVPWAFYAWRYIKHGHGQQKHQIPGSNPKDHGSERDAHDMFNWHWDALVKGISEPCQDYHKGTMLVDSNSHDSHSQFNPVRMRKDLAGHLTALFSFIEEMVSNAYREGRKNGEDLLVRLASGDISAKDFNEHSIKPDDEE